MDVRHTNTKHPGLGQMLNPQAIRVPERPQRTPADRLW